MVLSRAASLRFLGMASKSLLQPRHKVEMTTALTRLISSTEKKTAVTGRLSELPPPDEIENPPRTAEDFMEAAVKPRNWISYGFSYHDRHEDADAYHFQMFALVSVFLVLGSAYIAYLPDFKQEDWVLREAYLELARREKYGLPLVDKELIPVDRIKLPTEEEIEELGCEVYL